MNQKQKQIENLFGEVKMLRLQKDKILQTKIVEFQNSQIEAEKRQKNSHLEEYRKQQQKYEVLKYQQEAEFNAKLASVQYVNEQERARICEQNLRLQLSNEYEIKILVKQKQKLQEQLREQKDMNSELNKQIREYVAKEREYLVTISERDSALRDKNNEIQDIQRHINV